MKKEIYVLLFVSMVANFGVGLFGPLYAIYVEKIGGNILSASGAWAAFALATGVITIFLGRLEDRKLNRRMMIFTGYIILAIGSLSYYFVHMPYELLAVQVVLGIGNAIIEPAWDGIYSVSLDKGKESYEWSLWSGSINIVLALAALVGGVAASTYGFGTVFILMFCMNIMAAMITLNLPKKLVSM